MKARQALNQFPSLQPASLAKLKRLALRHGTSWGDPASQALLRLRYLDYRNDEEAVLPNISDVGFQIFSATDEDGILLYLATLVGAPKTFVDIGAAGIEGSNTANLAVHHGWSGLHVDGSESALSFAQDFFRSRASTRIVTPTSKQEFVSRENVLSIIDEAGMSSNLGLLSIDIDGNDYWVWEELGKNINPSIVVVEFQPAFGNLSVTVPYDAEFDRSKFSINSPPFDVVYCGASLRALTGLGERLGYKFVGTDSSAVNGFFVRKDICPERLEPGSIEDALAHPRVKRLSDEYLSRIQQLPLEEV